MDVSGNISAVLGQKSREIFSVTPDTCVDDAVKTMDEKNVGALLVMKGNKLVGMVSERDYTRKVMLRGKKSSETKVSEIIVRTARPFSFQPSNGEFRDNDSN